MEKQKHFYILPDGRRADNMKEGCELMGISSESFRRLIKKQVIIKSKSDENDGAGKQ